MFCQKCGAAMDDGAKFCPSCGLTPEVPAQEAVSQPSQAPDAVESQGFGSFGDPAGFGQPTPKPVKKKKWLPIAIIAVVLVVAIVGAAIGIPAIINGLKEPGEYYADIEYKNLSDHLNMLEENTVDPKNYGYDSSVSITLEQGAKDLLKSMGVDLDQYITGTKVTIDMDASVKGDLSSANVGLLLNDVDLLSMTVLLDAVKGEMYMNIPLLGDETWKLPMLEDVDAAAVAQYQDALQSSSKLRTAAMDLLPFVEKYLKSIFDNMVPFEKEKDELTVGGQTAEYDLYIANATEQQLAVMFLSVMEEIKADTDFRAALENLFDIYEDVLDEDMSGYVDDFYNGLDEAIEEMKNSAAKTDTEVLLTYRVWMDGKDVMARELRVPTDDEELLIANYNVLVSGKQTTKIVFATMENEFIFEGTAKRTGDRLTNGTYKVILNDKYYDEGGTILNVKVDSLDLGKLEDGACDLDITLSLGADIAAVLDSEAAFLADGEVRIVMTGDSRTSNAVLAVKYNDKALATLVVDYAIGEGMDITLPTDAEELNEDSFSGMNAVLLLGKLLSKLQEAGVSEELINQLPELGASGGDVSLPGLGM